MVVGIVLSVAALCVWGAWPFARAQCSADTPVFFVMYALGGLLVGMCTTLGTGQSFVPTEYAPQRIMYVILGGIACGHGDFLVVCAFKRIPSFIAFPLYTGKLRHVCVFRKLKDPRVQG
jgi:glucose uptake protein GlcU